MIYWYIFDNIIKVLVILQLRYLHPRITFFTIQFLMGSPSTLIVLLRPVHHPKARSLVGGGGRIGGAGYGIYNYDEMQKHQFHAPMV